MIYIKQSPLMKKIRDLCVKIYNKIENNGDANFYQNGEYTFLNNLFDDLKKNEKRRVIFDIGANIGTYTEMVIKESNKYNTSIDIHLFEPTKSCYEELKERLSDINHHIRLFINNFGASNKNEEALIYYDSDKSGLASLYQRNLDFYNIRLSQSENIRLQRLDEYIEKNRISHVDFIKIDIEGHELRAFEGFGRYMDSSFIDYIQFEYGGANLDSHTSLKDIYSFLEDKGFELAKVMPKGLEKRIYSPSIDKFDYANYVAISKEIL